MATPCSEPGAGGQERYRWSLLYPAAKVLAAGCAEPVKLGEESSAYLPSPVREFQGRTFMVLSGSIPGPWLRHARMCALFRRVERSGIFRDGKNAPSVMRGPQFLGNLKRLAETETLEIFLRICFGPLLCI